MEFKLLRGTHSQSEPVKSGDPCKACGGSGKIEISRRKGEWDCPACKGTGIEHEEVIYYARGNSLVKSDIDLEAKHGIEKFQNLSRVTESVSKELQEQIARLQAENAELKSKLGGETTGSENSESEVDYESMTNRQLRNLATEIGVDENLLAEVTKKSDIIYLIESHKETV